MPTFTYAARDQQGKAVNGTLEAPSVEALADQLRAGGYVMTQSREVAGAALSAGFLARLRRVGHQDMVLFNVQLAKLVQVGIPLVNALHTMAEQTVKPRFHDAIVDVARQIEQGASFSQALARHPQVFSTLFTSMVRAGEASSRLDEVLRRLAGYAKRQAALQEQLRTAMIYPIVLVCMAGGISSFLVMGIIPKFMETFRQAHVPVPLPTLLLYWVSQLMRHYWWMCALAVIGFAWALARYLRTPSGRQRRDRLLLKLPVLGELIRQTAIARLASSLGTLFAAGVPVLESLTIAEQTCGNTVIAGVCRGAYTSVKQGGSISAAFRASRQMPPMVVQMTAVGETTSALGSMMEEIAQHYDEMIEHTLKRVTALMEPLFLVVLGSIVGFIMASLLLPIFRMVQVVH